MLLPVGECCIKISYLKFQLSRKIINEAIYFQLAILRCLLILSADNEKVFPNGAGVKNSPANAGDARDAGSTPGSGRSTGK